MLGESTMKAEDKVGVCIAKYGEIRLTCLNSTDIEKESMILNEDIFSKAIYLTIKENSNMGEEEYGAIYDCLLTKYLKIYQNCYYLRYIPNIDFSRIGSLVFLQLCRLVFSSNSGAISTLECFINACYYDSIEKLQQISVIEAERLKEQLNGCDIINLYKINFQHSVSGIKLVKFYWKRGKFFLENYLESLDSGPFHNGK